MDTVVKLVLMAVMARVGEAVGGYRQYSPGSMTRTSRVVSTFGSSRSETRVRISVDQGRSYELVLADRCQAGNRLYPNGVRIVTVSGNGQQNSRFSNGMENCGCLYNGVESSGGRSAACNLCSGNCVFNVGQETFEMQSTGTGNGQTRAVVVSNLRDSVDSQLTCGVTATSGTFPSFRQITTTCPGFQRQLDIGMAFDNTFVTANGGEQGARNRWADILNIVQTLYNRDLQTIFNVVEERYLVGVTGNILQTNQPDPLLRSFCANFARPELGLAAFGRIDAAVLMTSQILVDPAAGNARTLGLAFVGASCTQDGCAIASDTASPPASGALASIGNVVAHEVGHTLNMVHLECNNECVMAAAAARTSVAFSTTSINTWNCFASAREQCFQVAGQTLAPPVTTPPTAAPTPAPTQPPVTQPPATQPTFPPTIFTTRGPNSRPTFRPFFPRPTRRPPTNNINRLVAGCNPSAPNCRAGTACCSIAGSFQCSSVCLIFGK